MDTDELIRAALDRAAHSAPDAVGVRARLAGRERRHRRRRGLLVATGSAAGLLVVAGTSVGVVQQLTYRPAQPAAVVPTAACTIAVFLRPDVTPEQRDHIAAELQRIPQVLAVVYESSYDAYENFKIMFKDAPDLIASVEADDIPAAFRVIVAGPVAGPALLAEVREIPGVRDVVTANCTTPPGPRSGR